MTKAISHRTAQGYAIAARAKQRQTLDEVLYLPTSAVPITLAEHAMTKASFGKRARLCLAGDKFIGYAYPKARSGWVAQVGGHTQAGFASAGEAVAHLVERAGRHKSVDSGRGEE